MAALVGGWLAHYPILSVEDPLGEDDWEGFAAFTAAPWRPRAGGRRRPARDLRAAGSEEAARRGAANTLLIKPNQRGTLTEAKAAWDAAREAGFGGIVSARSGETEDVTIVHLAVGWRAPGLKVGSFARSERMAKWNEAIRIEESLA